MTIDDYFKEIDTAVQKCMNDDISNQDYVEQLTSNDIEKSKKIINIRKELLSPSDYERLGGYLAIGFFTNFESSERMSLFLFMFDIGNLLVVRRLKERFRVYDRSLKIFSKDGNLFDCIREKPNSEKDLELIDTKFLNNVQYSEVFERNGYYYQIEPFLNRASKLALCRCAAFGLKTLKPSVRSGEAPRFQ